MASRPESSSTKNVIIIPGKRNRPPDKSPSPPSTPKSSLQTLSYAGAANSDQTATPTQTLLGKRKPADLNDTARRPPPSHPVTPSRRASLPPIPLNFNHTSHHSPETLDPDHEMQDPFALNSGDEDNTGWEEEGRYMSRLSRIQDLLKEIRMEFYEARRESFHEEILNNQEVAAQVTELACLLPHPASPMLSGIANVQKLLEDLNAKLHKTDYAHHPVAADRSLKGSAHANGGACTQEPDRPPTPSSNTHKHMSHPPQTNQKPGPPTAPTQPKPTPFNPNTSHHPSRLVAQFLPTGIPEELRPDPSKIVADLNTAITTNHRSNPTKIVAASFNTQGNLIISTRSDQTASDLIKYRDTILPVLTNIGNAQSIELREDKKWFKIQIDGVNTSAISIGNERVPISPEMAHEELLACNPQYAAMLNSIVSKPRWLRVKEELLTTYRSSLVFATTDEAAARLVLKHRSLAAFGRHCTVRAFQDRPPVTQCRRCWRLDHATLQCKQEQRCRICSELHDETNHQHADPLKCHKCITAQEMGDTMDTTADGLCPHDIRCINCIGKNNADHNHTADARRCPARLEKYGTARENEKRTTKSDNPWAKAKTPKNKIPKTRPVNPSTSETNTNNRYTALTTELANHHPTPDHNDQEVRSQ